MQFPARGEIFHDQQAMSLTRSYIDNFLGTIDQVVKVCSVQ